MDDFQKSMNTAKWLPATVGGLVLCYCVFVLGYIATTPDIGIRGVLSDSAVDGNDVGGGMVIRGTWLKSESKQVPQVGDILLEVNKKPVNSFIDFTQALSELRSASIIPGGYLDPPGNHNDPALGSIALTEYQGQRVVRVKFMRPGESTPRTSRLEVNSLPPSEVILTFVWFLLQLAILGVSALAVWHRPFDRPVRLFYWMAIVTMGAFVGGFHWWVVASSFMLSVPFTVCAVLAPVVALHFFIAYPQPIPLLARFPKSLLRGLYAVPLLSVLAIVGMSFYLHVFSSSASTSRNLLGIQREVIYAYMNFAAVCFLLMLAALAYNNSRTRAPIERSQMRLMLGAGLFAIVPISMTLHIAFMDRQGFALGEARIPMFLAAGLIQD